MRRSIKPSQAKDEKFVILVKIGAKTESADAFDNGGDQRHHIDAILDDARARTKSDGLHRDVVIRVKPV